MVSSPPKRWGDLNFEKIKSLGERVFFHHMGSGASPYGGRGGGVVIKVTKGEGDIIQVKTIIIL